MADKTNSMAGGEAELRSAIVAFEQILDAEPNDRLALETLSDAYERSGDKARAQGFLIRLADVVANENDSRSAAEIFERLRPFASSPEIQQAQQRLQDILNRATLVAARAPPPVRRSNDITREVSLAWDLLQAGEISQEDYAIVVQDLSENSTKNLDVPVTVLHALQDRNFKNIERVLAFLARTGGKPLISLSHFEIQLDLAVLLPMDFLRQRGALVYEKIGRDLLVVLLNPFDTDLQDDVREATGRRCHFYLTSASEYDAMLANIRKLQTSLG